MAVQQHRSREVFRPFRLRHSRQPMRGWFRLARSPARFVPSEVLPAATHDPYDAVYAEPARHCHVQRPTDIPSGRPRRSWCRRLRWRSAPDLARHRGDGPGSRTAAEAGGATRRWTASKTPRRPPRRGVAPTGFVHWFVSFNQTVTCRRPPRFLASAEGTGRYLQVGSRPSLRSAAAMLL